MPYCRQSVLQQVEGTAVNIFCRYDMVTALCQVLNGVGNWLLHRMQLPVLQHRLPELRFSVQIHPPSGWSDVRKCCRHLPDQILLLHDRSYGIHKKMSGRSALLLHRLPDPGFPVLHEAVRVSNLNFLSALFNFSAMGLYLTLSLYVCLRLSADHHLDGH